MKFRENQRWDDIFSVGYAARQHAWDRRHFYRRAVAAGVPVRLLAKANGVTASTIYMKLSRALVEHEQGKRSPGELWMARGCGDVLALAKKQGATLWAMQSRLETRRALYEALREEFEGVKAS